MRLLFVNQHYPPDSGATGALLSQLAECLARSGHEVTVLTGRPTYGEARDRPAPRREVRNGVRILRLAMLDRRPGPAGRTLHYLWFAIALLGKGLRLPRPDVLMAWSSTPLFGGAAARMLAGFHRCPFVYGVQDVYPEIAVALGLLRNPLLERLGRFLESFAWRGASRVVVIARDLLPAADHRGVPLDRVVVIPNWADTERIVPLEKSPFREEMGLADEDFVVEYAGNLGHSQDLGTVLEAARIVSDRARRPIRFLIVGSGDGAEELRRTVRGIPGVALVAAQPEERVAEVLSAADLSLIPLKRGLSRYCVPSKVYSILASGRPVGAVVDAESEVARIVRESECGFRVNPGDSEALAREILRLADDPDRARRLGRHGRAFGERSGSLVRAAGDYEALFRDVFTGSRSGTWQPTRKW